MGHSGSLNQKFYRWTDWKAALAVKSGVVQYDDNGASYDIYFYSHPEAHVCTIWKAEVPYAIVPYYSQIQNDADKLDFLTNYQPTAGLSTSFVNSGNVGDGCSRVVIASDNPPIQVSQSGTWATRIQDSSGTSITLGQKTKANSIPVVIASDQDRSSTVTHTNVAGSASAVTLQAANTARLGWSMYNDSNRDWYVRWGASASTTNFDVLVIPNAYLEIPFKYTGIITGIQTVANGNARVAEFT